VLRRYAHWLHTRWPAGSVERLPDVGVDGSTSVPGVYIVGDLTGIPLLKFALDSGAKAVRLIAAELQHAGTEARGHEVTKQGNGPLDLAIVGGGVSGFAAALEAQKLGLRSELIEAAEPFSTIANFPKAKPIYTYPTEMTPAGDLQVQASVKEQLIAELQAQTIDRGIRPRVARVEGISRRSDGIEVILADQPPILARRVIIAIGRSGDFRRLNVPGEDLPKVYNRLHDPADFAARKVLVVGGGDSALETAIALAECGANVKLCYRGSELTRPKHANLERLRRLPIRTMLGTHVDQIRADEVVLREAGSAEQTIPNDSVFAMIGREAPLDLLRRSGIRIRGDWTLRSVISLALVLAACIFIYHWKKGGTHIADLPGLRQISQISATFEQNHWFPYNVPALLADDRTPLLKTLLLSLGEPGFYYSLAYCGAVIGFGIARIRRRRTRYVLLQTATLAAIQLIPLFVLPYLLLPWMGHHGWFDQGHLLRPLADALFPAANYGHGREYWRAFGLILAWPLFIWNVFTAQPMWAWLLISLVQTFVLIPLIVWRWGKGAYCGWICSCGALAETMGDAHRHKMPHGPVWNRLNMIGQALLAFVMLILAFRIIGWVFPASIAAGAYEYLLGRMPVLNYVWFVDLFCAGILGVGLYWHFSGRVWCRFACPLAALMHIYARFSRFRILAEKSKCISCNVCTSVCHQGIDVMSFANRGLPMEDPQCVRCSACVQSCPTGVLQFGRIGRQGEQMIDPAWLSASPVRTVELTIAGRGTR
jgi:thioredoxin reductase/ferredoxin